MLVSSVQCEKEREDTLVLGLVVSLLLLDGAVVIDKDKGVFVLRIGVALSASVSRAEVACWVIFREGGFGRRFLLSSIFVNHLVQIHFHKGTDRRTAMVSWFGEEKPGCMSRGED